jgi:hypothetical protein
MRIVVRMDGGCSWPLRRGAAAAFLALALSGCASGITTPLPDVPATHVAPQLNLQERKKAVSDLEKAGAEHEEAAERQIEQSR